MFAKFTSLVLLSLAAFNHLSGVAALPQGSPAAVELTDADVPEVVPGPGLPSLESLGLTSAGLWAKAREHAEKHERVSPVNSESSLENENLKKRYVGACLHDRIINRAAAYACYDSLNGLGTTSCYVPSGGSTFCHSGGVYWTGRPDGAPTAASWW
ncbi:hypothetical protein CC1G_02565 [Coprinopsis cinerea okayama7|uniref:SCP domain-containing protein n=1 Tax=Coprinopsis cinerea (strain Okayama-7 / 130 / ATCC MYA-4618 / FGSC 9003) TaxID=240176 RepID=A8PB55_COPC7|nr:hypothetical protein CC1G_02565 [Coprinopsis cinerea okayama7\|eukprot:XP_001840102.2 hypothetical protein CC1G_02565 [Coprinopsis cinerea okayama7\